MDLPEPDQAVGRLDAWQQRHPVPAVVVAVARRFSSDGASQYGAAIAFYGVLSVFPLLLLFATITGWVLQDDPDLARRIVDSATGQVPVLGENLGEQIGSLPTSGWAALVSMAGLTWTGTRVLVGTQRALDRLWGVEPDEQVGALRSRLRSLLLLVVLGLALVASTVATALGSALTGLPVVARVVGAATGGATGIAVFAATFHWLPTERPGWRKVWPGAVLGGVGWWALHSAGSLVVSALLRNASGLYGTFGLSLALMTWVYLLAQLLLVAAELNVVLARRAWPVSLSGDDGPTAG